MAGTTRRGVNLESKSARARLKKGRQPHWVALVPRRLRLGWQAWKGEAGRWIVRSYHGSHLSKEGKPVADYRRTTIGQADDAAVADGREVLTYAQAAARALSTVDVGVSGPIHGLTVRQACEMYLERARAEGRAVDDPRSKMEVGILPELGDELVEQLTAARLRTWLDRLAQSPRQTRPINGMAQYLPKPDSADALRARRSTANRTLALLKSVLNLAHAAGHVGSAAAWGKPLKRFRNTERARVRFFSTDEASRLINAADPDFRPLLRAALETGARYSELATLTIGDFNADSGTSSRSGSAPWH